MQSIFKRICVLALAAIMIFPTTLTAAAEEHYDVYNYDRWDEAIPSQAGYLATKTVSGDDLGIGAFSEPSDIFRDAHDQFFIVDTKNNRIVVTDTELEDVVMVMEEFTMPDGSVTALKEPEGVYVAPETDLVYIADHNNSRVLVTDYDCHVQMELTRPETELFSQELTFLPQKVLADRAGNIYVVLSNITTGAAMFNAEGEFQGYYGANTVEATSAVIANYFWKMISTEEMRSRQARTVPAGITNFDLDDEGFIYTCTQSTSQQADTIKKLNPAGKNLFSGMGVVWGDMQSVWDANTSKNYQSMICDVEISDDGNINCLDLTTGRVFQYDEDGNLLFILGSSSDQLGGFKEVTAIESYGNQLLVLDTHKNTITVFDETDFGAVVHKATVLYNEGCYEEALEPWFEVLRYDGNYRRAFLGISAAKLVQGEYADSMKYAKLADSPYRYNRAFEGYRREWLHAHMTDVVVVMAILIIAIAALQLYLKKSRKPSAEYDITRTSGMMELTNLQWVKHAIMHPFEGFEDMRWKKAGSGVVAVAVIFLWFVAAVFYNRLYGFQFYVESDKLFNVIPYIVRTIVLFLIWGVGNWSVCTLLDGEGTMRNIYVYSAYALIPYVASIYIDVCLSHFLIRDEFVFIQAVRIIGVLWTTVLLFSAIRSVHQYSFLKTLCAIFLTIVSMLIMLFLLVLLLALFQQVYVFVYSVYTEAAYRLKV